MMSFLDSLSIADPVKEPYRGFYPDERPSLTPPTKSGKHTRLETAQPILIVENGADNEATLSRAARQARFINPLVFLTGDHNVEPYLDGAGIYANRHKFPLPALVLQEVTLPKLESVPDRPWPQQERTSRHVVITDLTGMVEPRHFESAVAFGARAILCNLRSPDSMTAMFRVLRRTCIEE